METTRGQVLSLLRRGPRTVEELARELDLTDNAIRAHLATLERDGLVTQAGLRRGAGAGKPAAIYELTPEVEVRLSRAYAPVLGALLDELANRFPREQTEDLLRAVGHRLAAAVHRREDTPEGRARQAVALLNELGGDASLEADGSGYLIRGCGCPVSAAVSRRSTAFAEETREHGRDDGVDVPRGSHRGGRRAGASVAGWLGRSPARPAPRHR